MVAAPKKRLESLGQGYPTLERCRRIKAGRLTYSRQAVPAWSGNRGKLPIEMRSEISARVEQRQRAVFRCPAQSIPSELKQFPNPRLSV
jgi:hypothetical protein